MGVTYRIKCPNCGAVSNFGGVGGMCTSCHSAINMDNCGFLDIYRMGSPLGIAVGFGIYIDGVATGHVGNKETVRIVLPYGEHNLHIAFAANRRCNDLKIVLTPQQRIVYTKVYMVPGFWTNSFNLSFANESEMNVHEPIPGGNPQMGYAAAPQMNYQQAPQMAPATRNVFCAGCGNPITIEAQAHGVLTCPTCATQFNV